MGVIRYFPHDEVHLSKMVILDPQLLFDKVTELITETFTFEHAGYRVMKEFSKGIFCFSDFEKISQLKHSDPSFSVHETLGACSNSCTILSRWKINVLPSLCTFSC